MRSMVILGIAACLLALAPVGSGARAQEAAQGAAAAPAEDALARIARTGRIRLGYRADAPPFSYVDDRGAPAGLAVALCARVAQTLSDPEGAAPEPVWLPVTAQSRFAALTEGRIDLLCGPATQTLSRRQTLDFSIPYFIDGAAVAFRRGGAERLAQLSDEPVGVLAGTTTEAVAARRLREAGARSALRRFATHEEGLRALARGEIEAYFADRAILHYQLGRLRPATPLVISDEALSFEPYALTMKRGETRLRLAVDAALSRIYRTGAIYDLIAETMGRVSLGPLAEALYEVVALPE
ncbi:amino acid ABC transporter substrate-binding protein [Oceanicella actignis]|uniref:Polar amino acid transport system substrate-binding protein/glutamate/aspartate transport system substrate-binding protein n=1 Tax=Oceanicella actignis TaxID=1189325 RepID=A0A1M7SG90_9RHOB|nr:amino acid ABC transporter substrate-binding protein [Oceanicella actignis]SET21556.1 polar amino acid transport system substrate-binding protein [Oceanicella actignis]SHN57450.1 polar amino acid transport system substrate-binding protein/glutamate/aspartate transport system substrate-binding protein [Oceanicella actignis]